MTDTESAASFAEPQLDSPLPVGSGNRPISAKPLGLWADTWRRLRRNKLALVGLGIITVFIFIGVAQILAGVTGIHGGYLAPYNPNAVDYSIAKHAPSLSHPFGTDYIGRDVFSRTLVATRISLLVGVIAVSIALALGLALGPLSGYYGGAIDSVIMRVADVFFAFPYILFVLLLVVVLGPGFRNVFIAIGLLSWASYARIVRGTVLSVKTMEYIEAAKAAGASDLRIIFGHVLPNSMAPVYVSIAMGIGGAIVTEAALSFLGIGVQPPTASWGNMISDYLNYLQAGQWWMELFPCLALVITVFGFISFGNGLRDATDPKLKE
jgi:peptide/nickel transport system permease protein